MGGLGYKTETYMPLPSEIGLSMTISDYTTAWVNSSDLFIDTYNQNLLNTPFVVAAGVPFSDSGAATAITSVINHGLLYPLFGIAQWGLKATSNNGFFLNQVIQANAVGRATGFQLAGASDGSVGGDLQGTLEQALAAGLALGADWIEIYAADAMNPVYAPLLLQYNFALTPSPTATVQNTLLNVSTRAQVLSGDGVTIGGFIVSGDAPKRVALRALGPSLANAGVAGVLADPLLGLYDSKGSLIQQNDDWTSPLPDDVVAGGLTPNDPAESLIVATLAPGGYTAVLRGTAGSSGVALFELYDLDPASSRISNLSTRGEASSGNQAMIAGFIIGGTEPTEILIRAIGPSLTSLGVSGALLDPVLELRGSDGSLIAENDTWRSNQQEQILATTIPPSDDKESAIIATLAPGNYTALVTGAGTSSGIALVEVYNLTSN